MPISERKQDACEPVSAAGSLKKRLARVYLLVAGAAALACVLLAGSITDAPNRSDARQNLQAAWNLYAWGVFSKNNPANAPPAPDNYREPFPPAVTALYLYLLGDGRICENGDCARYGFNNRTIKRINLAWSFLVLCASGALAYRLTRSSLCVLAVLILVYGCFLRNPAAIDTLYTEVPASACMLACALCCMACCRKPVPWLACAAGAVMGTLVLTKAIFLYAAPVLIVSAAAAAAVHGAASPAAAFRKTLVWMSLGLLIIAGPWLVRNAVHFGSLQISSRGGLALYTRALINQMDAFEYRAAFHAWGPGAYRRLVRDTPLDVAPAEYERGGRAARLNCSPGAGFAADDAAARRQGRPDQAVSFFERARAQRVRVQRDFRQAGCRNAVNAADRYLRNEALVMIARHPLRHGAATLPLAWRGMWCFYGGGLWTVLGAVACGAFACVAVMAVVGRNAELIAFAAVPIVMLGVYAFFTNNLPRFNAPAIPFMLIALMYAGRSAALFLGNVVRQRRARCHP